MPRVTHRMNTLELRKQLLIAESELNRRQLSAEKTALQTGMHKLTHGASSVGAMASSAVMLASDLAAIPRKRHVAGKTTSKLHYVLEGTILISTLLLALLPRKET